MTSDYSPAAFSFAISFRDDGAEAIDGAFQEVSGLYHFALIRTRGPIVDIQCS